MFNLRTGNLACTLLLLGARSAAAENLVITGQFDQPVDVDSWSVTSGDNEASMSFRVWPDESDCDGSGSALLVTQAPGELEVEYSVCAGGIAGGDQYAVGVEIFFPNGESEGSVQWGATWYAEPDCAGDNLGSIWAGPAGYSPDWRRLELWSSTPPEAVSARMQIWVSSLGATEPLQLNIDDAFVRPVEDLFADGFELGESCRWQSN